MDWSGQQDGALRSIREWLRSGTKRQQVFYLAGYAGTGKTTLAKEIASMVGGAACYAAFTGKAALVMRTKGCEGASTLHSLIYRAEEKDDGSFVYHVNHQDSPLTKMRLCIVDECSMVGEELARDLLSFRVPVLVIGDPAQLPPVKDAGFFTKGDPDVMLTEIHRQAADNPIIRLATSVRKGEKLSLGTYEGGGHPPSMVIPRSKLTPAIVSKTGQLIVGKNATRRLSNAKIRGMLGHEGDVPNLGERLICLRNKRDRGLLNGGMWIVREIMDSTNWWIVMKVADEMEPKRVAEVRVPLHFFQGTEEDLDQKTRNKFDEFDFGYTITAHKSQGSQWDDVTIIDESIVFKEFADRWLYTAVTRAASRVIIARLGI